jgi:hypothetical protein
MTIQTQDELRIKTPSKELFNEVITSVPLIPEQTRLIFLADGIDYSLYGKNSNLKEYLSKCSENKIIPFSSMELRSSDHPPSFKPFIYGSRIISIPEGFREYEKQAFDILISGGRIHRIKVNTNTCDQGRIEFEEFRNSVFNVLINQRYQINEGTLTLKTEKYSDNIHTGLILNNINRKGLELRIGDETDLGDKTKLKNWFSQLKDKYQTN